MGRRPSPAGSKEVGSGYAILSGMTWRRFHLLLCLIMVGIGVLRLASGNFIGGVIALVLAAVFGSIAADYPLLSRLRGVWRLTRRHLPGGKD